MKAEIWSKDFCPYCVKAKKLLTELNIPYDEYIISMGMGESTPAPNQFYATKAQLLEKLPTAKTVPQIWIDGRHVGGCDDLYAEYERGDIKAQ